MAVFETAANRQATPLWGALRLFIEMKAIIRTASISQFNGFVIDMYLL